MLDADLIPYGSALGNRARLGGLNLVGLKRSGTERRTIHALRHMFKALFVEETDMFAERVAQLAAKHEGCAEVGAVIAFLYAPRHRPILGVRHDA